MKKCLILFILSITLATISWLSFIDIFTFINNITSALNHPMVWRFSRYIFSIVILVLPTIYYLLLRNKKLTTKKIIFILSLKIIMWFCILLLTFLIVDKLNEPTSPFVPSFVVYEPFRHFWEIVFVISGFISFLITKFILGKISLT